VTTYSGLSYSIKRPRTADRVDLEVSQTDICVWVLGFHKTFWAFLLTFIPLVTTCPHRSEQYYTLHNNNNNNNNTKI